MTNIVAAVVFTVTTNWVTVSVTRPVPANPLLAIYQPEVENQIGARVTNTVALVVWKGKTNEVILESTPAFYAGALERSVPKGLQMIVMP